MLCNMESAAAETIESLLRATPPVPTQPENVARRMLVSRMAFVIEDRLSIGNSVTRDDFIRAMIPDTQIDELAEDAMKLANERMAAIAANGIRRARVAAGKAA